MLKLKVAALSITNLTDARYFAAYGVDFLGFVLDPEDGEFIGFDRIKEIVEWVEGPKILAQVKTEMGVDAFQDVLKLDGIMLPKCILIDDQRIDVFNFEEGENSNNCFLDNFESIEDIQFLIEQGKDIGIIVRGGDENKVGLKSYEGLDEIFELLLD